MSIAKELIDRVDELTLESELSVMNSLSKVYAKQAYMISQCDNLDALDAVFTEADTPAADAQPAAAPAGSAKTGTAKKGLLRKMFEAVKKFFALIARGLKLIVKLLGNIFRLPGKNSFVDVIRWDAEAKKPIFRYVEDCEHCFYCQSV